ncbi:hypothetical protein RchiOBHm_Chr2g0121771 [Rosa chinensis]|uniref:Uncharacterized protein n=1 Tax=Rosa chinensis TaxID=74649 RepID=A0A2P6RSL8_ROSCH|nr:hypothetical protein RchiOBHm_Chr2g0121771 [Rosa chinensis]
MQRGKQKFFKIFEFQALFCPLQILNFRCFTTYLVLPMCSGFQEETLAKCFLNSFSVSPVILIFFSFMLVGYLFGTNKHYRLKAHWKIT